MLTSWIQELKSLSYIFFLFFCFTQSRLNHACNVLRLCIFNETLPSLPSKKKGCCPGAYFIFDMLQRMWCTTKHYSFGRRVSTRLIDVCVNTYCCRKKLTYALLRSSRLFCLLEKMDNLLADQSFHNRIVCEGFSDYYVVRVHSKCWCLMWEHFEAGRPWEVTLGGRCWMLTYIYI